MNSKTYNLCEDWGWYIDIDNNSSINLKFNMIIYNTYKNKNYLKLTQIQEEKENENENDCEYEYYKNNYKDIEDLEYNLENQKDVDKKSINIILYNICSTTIITALLTYVIFFII